jgi:hypothetical protein
MAGIGWAPLGGEWWTWQWCVEDEQAKPAGERNERRLLALRKQDNRLHLAYYAVRAPKTRVWVSCAEFCRVPPSSRRLRRTAPFPGPLPSLLGLQHLYDGWKVAEEKCQALSQRSDGRGCCKASAQVQGRAAASYRAVAAFYRGMKTQAWEEGDALYEGRPAALKSLATLELQLPVEWVEHPPDRLDMCSACAKLVEQVGGRAGGWVRGRAPADRAARQWQADCVVVPCGGEEREVRSKV